MTNLAADVRPAKINGAPERKATGPTRRAMLGGAGLIVLATTAVGAATLTPDIERHWQDRRKAYREFDADPLVLYDDRRAQRYWTRIDAAEVATLDSVDTSARATEIRLWTAWSHTDRELEYAITQEDAETLRGRFADLDWHEKLIFAAILALRDEGQPS